MVLMAFSSLSFSFETMDNPPDSTQSTKKGMIYDYPEIMPQFPGGPDAMDLFIKQNLKKPADAKDLSGKVYVQFVVEKDGSISDVSIRMGKYEKLNKEAIRLVKMMPDWRPGVNKGKKVRVRYILPITFH